MLTTAYQVQWVSSLIYNPCTAIRVISTLQRNLNFSHLLPFITPLKRHNAEILSNNLMFNFKNSRTTETDEAVA